MPVLIVTAAILVGAGLILKALWKPDPIFDSIRSYERRERCNGVDLPYWPTAAELAELRAREKA